MIPLQQAAEFAISQLADIHSCIVGGNVQQLGKPLRFRCCALLQPVPQQLQDLLEPRHFCCCGVLLRL